jgi:hypothetical protein
MATRGHFVDQAGGTVQVMRIAHHKLVRDQIPESPRT